MKKLCAGLLVLLSLGAAASARADDAALDDAQVTMTLTPWGAYDGVERPFRFIVEMRARGGEPLEIVTDRRLLRFEVRPTEGRRRYRCRHPSAPSRVSEGRTRAAGDEPWREWIDLRMYCTGRALTALQEGATVEASYGWPRANRRRWVARRADAPVRAWTAKVDAAPFTFAPIPAEPTRRVGEEGESPIEISLSRTSARTAGGLVFSTAIRARAGSERVHDRVDAWGFRVRGPLGDVVCEVAMSGGSPRPDFFTRVTPRQASRQRLEADFFCPDHTFTLAGVYEITPVVRLPHSGEEWGLEAVTGRFVGPSVPIRITGGAGGYVEQIPERAASSAAAARLGDLRDT